MALGGLYVNRPAPSGEYLNQPVVNVTKRGFVYLNMELIIFIFICVRNIATSTIKQEQCVIKCLSTVFGRATYEQECE